MHAPNSKSEEVLGQLGQDKNVTPALSPPGAVTLISSRLQGEGLVKAVHAIQEFTWRRHSILLEVIGGGRGCRKVIFSGSRAVEDALTLMQGLSADPATLAFFKEMGFEILIDSNRARIDLRQASVLDLPKPPDIQKGVTNWPVDCALITALPDPEFVAVRNALTPTASQIESHSIGTSTYLDFLVPSGRQDHLTRIVATYLPVMGNAAAAVETEKTIRFWRPKYVFFVGIAGSLDSKFVRLGDVVFADNVLYYDARDKVVPKGRKPGPIGYKADRLLLNRAQFLLTDSESLVAWKADCMDDSPPSYDPQLHIGDIAAGTAVVDAKKEKARILRLSRKLLAVEMEGGGFHEAIISQTSPPRAAVVRGISDLAANKEGTKPIWRLRAARAAAQFVSHFVRRLAQSETKGRQEDGATGTHGL